MSSIKKCNVYLPNGKRLEIKLQVSKISIYYCNKILSTLYYSC